MEFKVGQKVRMVKNRIDARVGDVGIIRVLPRGSWEYAVEFPCLDGTDRGHYCHGTVPSGNGHWIDEDEMEIVQEKSVTLKEKLKAFKSGTAVLHAPTEELWDKLMAELEKQGYKWIDESNPTSEPWDPNRWVNYKGIILRNSGIAYWGDSGEIIELTPQDFYEITQVTIKDSSGTTTVRAKVIKGIDGYTIEKLAEPKFTVGEQFVTASGKLGKVTEVNPEGNYCVQWFNGKYCSAQPEDTMCKIVWDK